MSCLGLALAVLAFSGAGPIQADDPDLSWNPGNDFPGFDSATFIIYPKIFPWGSSIVACTYGPMICGGDSCSSLDDPRCALPARENGWRIDLAAPPCAEAGPAGECIERLRVTRPGGAPEEARLTGLANLVQFAANPDRGLPAGSAMSTWSDPASPDGSTGYAIGLGGLILLPAGHEFSAGNPVRFQRFGLQVWRYRYVPASQRPWYHCLWTGGTNNDQCAIQIPFEDGARLEVSFLVNNAITGWMSGRLRDPDVVVAPAGGGLNRVTVSALPVDVPMVAGSVPIATASEEIRRVWRDVIRCPDGCQMAVDSDGSWVPLLLRLFADVLGDTAWKTIPTWSLSSVEGIDGSVSPCTKGTGELVGLVTTNATGYDAGPPQFVDGTLRYSVSALHKVPPGETFRGTYDLLVRSDTARCIYGFDDAPIRAEIQVISEDGEEQVTATSVSESLGWLHLAATGFTFSNPTISVKLSTEAPPSAPPGAVVGLTAVRLKGAIRVAWSAPSDTGGDPSISYRYRVGKGKWSTTSETAVLLAGKRGKPLTVAVRAVNGAGAGPILRVTAKPR